MINGSPQIDNQLLHTAFEHGFNNAVNSLCQFVPETVGYEKFYQGFHQVVDSSDNGTPTLSRGGTNYLITTEVFGDVTGKSYLLISQSEYEILTRSIPDKQVGSSSLKDEFIKELDNILSASVITKLSNELNRNLYGDIPILIGKVASKIEDVIYDDFSEVAEEVYVNTGYFSLKDNPEINPYFVWVIDMKSLNIENKTSTVLHNP